MDYFIHRLNLARLTSSNVRRHIYFLEKFPETFPSDPGSLLFELIFPPNCSVEWKGLFWTWQFFHATWIILKWNWIYHSYIYILTYTYKIVQNSSKVCNWAPCLNIRCGKSTKKGNFAHERNNAKFYVWNVFKNYYRNRYTSYLWPTL